MFIDVESATIGNARISRFTRFAGPMRLHIGNGARIGARNKFNCGLWTIDKATLTRTMHIGERAGIEGQHFFDIAGTLEIGEGTWIAGLGSQFWTHGAGVADRDVSIGANCYIGSAVRFAPGSKVADGCIVGLGSVVTRKFEEPLWVIGGIPARQIKPVTEEQARRPQASSEEMVAGDPRRQPGPHELPDVVGQVKGGAQTLLQ